MEWKHSTWCPETEVACRAVGLRWKLVASSIVAIKGVPVLDPGSLAVGRLTSASTTVVNAVLADPERSWAGC